MNKVFAVALVALCIAGTASAQKKYDKLAYKDVETDVDDVHIVVKDAVSNENETKLKVVVTNKSKSCVIYKPAESAFVLNGKESMPDEKQVVIAPGETESKVVRLRGSGFNAISSFPFKLGGLYKVPSEGAAVPGPDFKLDEDKPNLSAGGFDMKMMKLEKENKRTFARFVAAHHGDKTGVIYPNKITVKMPDGKDYPATKVKPAVVVLPRVGNDDFILEWTDMPDGKDMKMGKVDMIVKWNDAIVECTPEKMKIETLTMNINESESK